MFFAQASAPPPSLTSFTDFCYLFLSIVIEGAPFILLGTIVSGFIDAYLPPGLIDRWLPKNRFLALILAALLGAIFPVCECAIVPVIRRLIKKGLPLACAITYMLSAPIINPIVILSTYTAFGTNISQFALREDSASLAVAGTIGPFAMTLSRLAVAFLLTVGVGLIVSMMKKESVLRPNLLKGVNEGTSIPEKAAPAAAPHTHSHGDHDHKHDPGHDHAAPPDRLVLAMRTAMRDFIDTAMFFTIGVAITATFRAYVGENLVLLFNQSEFAGIYLMMVLAFILSLCSTSDAFVAANFPVQSAAKLAFLVFGPMLDVKLVFMYLAVFRKKFVIVLSLSLFVITGVLCYLWVHLIL